MSTITSPGRNLSIVKLCAAACIALLMFSYRKAGSDLFAAWQTDEYSHGIIIPFIALLIGWHRLTENPPAVRPSWWGALLLIVCSGMLLVSVLSAFQTAAQYGFLLSLVALSLALLGKPATKTMAPAFIYLIFAIPLPHLIYANLSQDLQLISSTLGVSLLDLLNIPVFQEGNVIDLGQYKLQVVEACSGLRYLFPLISFGYLIGYLLQDRMWKRAVVFFSAVPITIGMNAFRIAVIGITVNLWGPQMAEGLVHELEGWVVFMFCILLLMGEVWFLLRLDETHGHFRFEIFTLPRGKMLAARPRLQAPGLAALALCAATAAIFGSGMIDERPEIIPAHPAFTTFPLDIHQWHGQQQRLEPDILKGLQLSDYWLADYKENPARPLVNFYIAYYDNQHLGSSTHSPSNCIPGGGWQIVSTGVKTITLADGKSMNVTRLLIKKATLSQLVYYWFDERGRNITETTSAKWYLLVDSIGMQRTDGALLRLVTSLGTGENEDDAEKRLIHFLSDASPVIKTYIPGKILIAAPNLQDVKP